MKKIASLVIIFCLILSACSSTNNEEEQAISGLDDGILDIGLECDYAPYNWTVSKSEASEKAISIENNNSGYCEGYDILIASDIAEDMGVELRVHAISWDGLIPALNSGTIDAVIAGMSPTAERAEQISFSDSYFTEDIKLQVVVGAESDYVDADSLDDFDGANISTQQGTFYSELISQMPGANAATQYDSYAALIQATESGVIDGYIAEQGVAEDQVDANSNLVSIIPSDDFTLTADQNTVAIGISKENQDLVAEVNKSLATISEDTRQEYMKMAISGNITDEVASVKPTSDILEDGILTVGMECNYAPYNWTETEADASSSAVKITDNPGYCEGYDVMIASNLAKQLGVDLEIKAIKWDGLIPAVNSGTIDAVIAGMSPTKERSEQINFTDSYFTQDINLQVVVAADSAYADADSLDDFEGAKISAQQGTFYSEVIPQLKGVELVNEYPSFDALIQATSEGVIDGYIAEDSAAQDQSESNEHLVAVALDPTFTLTPDQNTVAIGVSKENPELVDDLNKGLENINEDTRQTYMSTAIGENESETPSNTEETGTEESSSFLSDTWKLLVDKHELFIEGVLTTLGLAIFGTLFGFIIGCVLAAMRIIEPHYKDRAYIKVIKKVVNYLSLLYIDIIRGTPMMVQAMLFFYGVASGYLSPVYAGVVIVSFNTAAYVAEILRGGILSIDKGQTEAARSLGLSNTETLIKVIIPQAVKNTLPSLANELIVNIKDSSVLSVIGVTELFYETQQSSSASYQYTEGYFIAAILYLIMTITLSRLLSVLVRKIFGTKKPDLLNSESIQEVH